MQVHMSDTDEIAGAMHRYAAFHGAAETLAANYLSRKPGLTSDTQGIGHLLEQILDERQQAEDVLSATRLNDAPTNHGQPGVVHFSKTHAADAELDADGSIHLVPVRAKINE